MEYSLTTSKNLKTVDTVTVVKEYGYESMKQEIEMLQGIIQNYQSKIDELQGYIDKTDELRKKDK